MKYLVTRHPGAKAWVESKGIKIDQILDHFDPDETKIKAKDVVIGVLPPPLAAHICSQGARWFYLSMQVPREHRGKELTANDMSRFKARIDEYKIIKI